MKRRRAAVLVVALGCLGAGSAPAVPDSEEWPDGFVGVVIGARSEAVVTRVAGRLVAVEVRPGDRVRRGEVVARLDDRDARRALAMAEADLAKAGAILRKAEADQTLALSARERRVQAPDLFSEEEIIAAREQANAATAEAERAAAAVREAQLRVEQAQQDLESTQLESPVAGIVSLRIEEPGALVEPGDAVLRVAGQGERWVRFAVPPVVAARLRSGSLVRIRSPRSDTTSSAKILHVAPEADEASGLVVAEARLEPGPTAGAIPTGGTVRVTLVEAKQPAAPGE